MTAFGNLAKGLYALGTIAVSFVNPVVGAITTGMLVAYNGVSTYLSYRKKDMYNAAQNARYAIQNYFVPHLLGVAAYGLEHLYKFGTAIRADK